MKNAHDKNPQFEFYEVYISVVFSKFTEHVVYQQCFRAPPGRRDFGARGMGLSMFWFNEPLP